MTKTETTLAINFTSFQTFFESADWGVKPRPFLSVVTMVAPQQYREFLPMVLFYSRIDVLFSDLFHNTALTSAVDLFDGIVLHQGLTKMSDSCTVSCTNICHELIPNHWRLHFSHSESAFIARSIPKVRLQSPVINPKFFNCSLDTFLNYLRLIMRIPASRRSCNHRFISRSPVNLFQAIRVSKITKTAWSPWFFRLWTVKS